MIPYLPILPKERKLIVIDFVPRIVGLAILYDTTRVLNETRLFETSLPLGAGLIKLIILISYLTLLAIVVYPAISLSIIYSITHIALDITSAYWVVGLLVPVIARDVYLRNYRPGQLTKLVDGGRINVFLSILMIVGAICFLSTFLGVFIYVLLTALTNVTVLDYNIAILIDFLASPFGIITIVILMLYIFNVFINQIVEALIVFSKPVTPREALNQLHVGGIDEKIQPPFLTIGYMLFSLIFAPFIYSILVMLIGKIGVTVTGFETTVALSVISYIFSIVMIRTLVPLEGTTGDITRRKLIINLFLLLVVVFVALYSLGFSYGSSTQIDKHINEFYENFVFIIEIVFRLTGVAP